MFLSLRRGERQAHMLDDPAAFFSTEPRLHRFAHLGEKAGPFADRRHRPADEFI
jgi:hypothetical protein